MQARWTCLVSSVTFLHMYLVISRRLGDDHEGLLSGFSVAGIADKEYRDSGQSRENCPPVMAVYLCRENSEPSLHELDCINDLCKRNKDTCCKVQREDFFSTGVNLGRVRSTCIGENDDLDGDGDATCCEGLRPCEQVVNDMRFFICLTKCTDKSIASKGIDIFLNSGKRPHNPYAYLSKLTRYLSAYDERLYKKTYESVKGIGSVKPKITSLSRRPSQGVLGTRRFASPFEHVCGGATMSVNKDKGTDGPTQFISFTNAGQYPEYAEDCNQPFDKGQRRIKVSAETVFGQGGIVINLSNENWAFKWCYDGGCVKYGVNNDKQLCFDGARTAKPWPYKCASRAYQIVMKNSHVKVPDSWWTPENRVLIARSCQVWASRAREVIVLPNPETFRSPRLYKKMRRISCLECTTTKIHAEVDRKPAKKQCDHNDHNDHCISFDEENEKVQCCADPAVGVPCASRTFRRGRRKGRKRRHAYKQAGYNAREE